MRVRMLVDEVPFVYMAHKIYLRAPPDALPASVAEVTICLRRFTCLSHPQITSPTTDF